MVQYEYKSHVLSPKQKEDIEIYLCFIAKLSMHNLELASAPSKLMAVAIVGLALKNQAKLEKKNIKKVMRPP
jgi:hypothetical protein